MMENQGKITIGQNLKKIRKELGLKQYEITGGEITRNLISIIENDKTPLYETNARIISENMNSIMEERGLDIYIEPEDILNPERYEAKKKADLYIENFKTKLNEKNFEIESKELQEIELFLNHWNLNDKKAKIYELLGDIYYYSHDFDKEFIYLTKALECAFMLPNRKNNYKILSKLISNCINTEKYKEALRLGNFGLSSQKNMPEKVKGIFHYNNALAYENLEKFDSSIEELNIAKKHIEDINSKLFIKMLVLEGICYSNKKEYDKALNTYNQAIDIFNLEKKHDEIYLIYANIVDLFVEKKDVDKVAEYLNTISKHISNIDENSPYLARVFFSISDGFFFLKNYDSAEECLKKSLYLAEKNNEKNLYEQSLLKLFNFYVKENEKEKIYKLKDKLSEEILNISVDEKLSLFLNLILYYLEHNDIDLAKQLVQELLKKEVRK